ncbi:MaoC family dehydratase [Pokkaliibacter sp. MBI-7]|uniref:MaoC family dehydratase n=1 Tax=Pokkaliibacter sp. MBI-7 TaxID=3040600 RepID=UPI0024481412|nr:MaoC family dehydratase [Pokkaliibacter sp. MBI-7]MDH2431770.1 MaoC family dehydratase [Pokkaliibacter sp. MBI-7]
MSQSSATPTLLYLQDLQVGQRFVSGVHSLTAEQIKQFAAEFDPQPFHLDEDAAQQTFFAGLAASGWHTAALTMRMLVESVPIAGGLVGAGGEVQWKAPTRPGDQLRAESEIIEITPSRSRPDRGMVVMRTTTYNQDNQALQIFTGRIVVPCRS